MEYLKLMCCGIYLSLPVYLCETEPSARPSSATTDPRCRQRRDPESLCGCSAQSVQCAKQEFHTVIFVPKDTTTCQQDCNWGASFHWLLTDNGRRLPQWPWHRIGAYHADIALYCVSSLLPFSESQACHLWQTSVCVPRTCRLVNLRDKCSVFRPNHLESDGCLCYRKVHSMITKHNMLQMPHCDFT